MAECSIVSFNQVSIKINEKLPIKQEETLFQCNSIEDAVKHILIKGNPNLLAFGETHPRTDDWNKPTPLKLFSNQILPLLREHEYYDLVIEMFYSNEIGDRTINNFIKTGELKYDFRKNIYPSNGVNQSGLDHLLKRARDPKKPVSIYGGGPRYNDRETPYIYDIESGRDKSNAKLIALTRRITQRTTEKALKLLMRPGSKKVITYNGGYHNDVINQFGVNGFSFGEFFIKKTKYKYVEVDLLSPEMMNYSGDNNYAYPEYERWLKTAVPQKGVMLIKRGDSSYTIMFPAGVLIP